MDVLARRRLQSVGEKNTGSPDERLGRRAVGAPSTPGRTQRTNLIRRSTRERGARRPTRSGPTCERVDAASGRHHVRVLTGGSGGSARQRPPSGLVIVEMHNGLTSVCRHERDDAQSTDHGSLPPGRREALTRQGAGAGRPCEAASATGGMRSAWFELSPTRAGAQSRSRSVVGFQARRRSDAPNPPHLVRSLSTARQVRLKRAPVTGTPQQ